ncbi:hypothetical protein [Jannaschia seohaensis]|uniref:Calcineurin-like phosphoesterase family protein n=1 Tax=Jannaschia seohaensis TaxID=475081 RepID=A0A2Y9B486_9RHOB|nr:hypothetical protein [Jannaschia seohaensis]PWJ12118.1 hypothetical protein BCF38_11752 [Jannaschia seohaensis]SSA51221.1 hypothetical protein SAMN05421539_11752 [Jannaschia seohaensis]
MRIIGDIHGRRDLYARALAGAKESVQIGDFGMGFIPEEDLATWPGGPGHKFFRGNHDDPALCRAHPAHLESGPYGNLFVVGGGWSIDREYRTPGVTWWPDEELPPRSCGI